MNKRIDITLFHTYKFVTFRSMRYKSRAYIFVHNEIGLQYKIDITIGLPAFLSSLCFYIINMIKFIAKMRSVENFRELSRRAGNWLAR